MIPTGPEKVRSNDTAYRFRPGSEFYYLTGNLEPDCVLLMLPRAAAVAFTRSFKRSRLRATAITSAPSAASADAMARPSPREAPVTTA